MNSQIIIILILIWVYTSAELKNEKSSPELIILNTNIITLENDKVLHNKDIRITDDEIREIGVALTIPDGAHVVDGEGLYIMPALFDMHAHIGAMNPWHEYYLGLYSYFGIHHVNLMASDNNLRELIEKYNSRQVKLGPAITLASELIDGDPPMWGDQHNGPILTDIDQVEDTIRNLKEKGYRDLKVYNRLSPGVYNKILEEAEKMKMRVVGHVPYSLPLNNRLDPRHQRIEHLEGYLEYSFSGDLAEIKDSIAERNAILTKGFDKGKMIEGARLTAERNIWNTPTHVLFASLLDSIYIQEMMYGEISELMDPGLQQFWDGVLQNPNAMAHIRSEEFRNTHIEMIRILHQAGAPILAGTDAPLPVLLYGHSLHKELQYFVEAGMSPFEALKTATVNPAEYLGLEKSGKILEGYEANLLILKKNPLENIEHTLEIEGIISGKRYLERPEIESILLDIRENLLSRSETN